MGSPVSRRSKSVDPALLGDIGVRVSAPLLTRVMLEGQDPEGTETDTSHGENEARFRLRFSAARTEDASVTIELGAEGTTPENMRFEIGYQATLTVEQPDANGGADLGETLANVAFRLGPVVAYPYIRETLTTLTTKAGIQSVVLPIINVGAIFEPSELEDHREAAAPQPQAKPKRTRKQKA